MVNYVMKRVGHSIATVFVVITLTFMMVRLLPGGPADYVRAQLMESDRNIDEQRVNALVEAYTSVHPEKPLAEAYFEYIINLSQAEFGQSLFFGREVEAILAEAIPWTVFVVGVGIIGTYAIGLVFGAVMAYFEGSRFDLGSTLGAVLLGSVPYYVYAVIFLFFLGFQFELFPTGGRYSSADPGYNLDFLLEVLHHAALPISSFVIAGWGTVALTMRGNSISTLGSDYVRVGRLRGLSERRIALKYVGRNSILPMYTSFMISIGFLFGGSVILESIFRYIGVGYYLFESVSSRDYPLMMGCFILLSISVVIGVLIADLTYSKIDPRIKQGDHHESF